MSHKYVKILDFPVFSGTFEEGLDEIKRYDKVNIISANPEVLYLAIQNENLKDNFTSKNAFIIPDGVGTVLAAKMLKSPVKEKIAGVEFMQAIIKKCEEDDKAIYLLGASQDVIEECVKKIKFKHPNINIVGYKNGYFREEDEGEIVEEILKCNPYAIFIALGCPKQENFINKYMSIIPSKIFMGVGGSFDVISGKVKRAPRLLINIRLEWLYRVFKEPKRIKRLASIPKFLKLVKKFDKDKGTQENRKE